MRALIVLSLSVAACMAQVELKQSPDRISVTIDRKPFTDFFIGAEAPKPYLHPLRTASGKIITRSYPMETLPGEAKDHPHHRGLWFTHGLVNDVDFWANEKNQKGAGKAGRGTVVTKRITELKSGKKQGTIGALFEWQDAGGTPLLSEQRTLTFYSHPTERWIDVDTTLTAMGKVVFGDTKEGTFAMRLATPLEEKNGGMMRSAEGKTSEKAVWGTRSAWVDTAGTIDGEKAGVAILDHPTNPRHPTYWHSRAYGLFAANPFGVRDFERDKTRNGDLSLEKGATLRFRYRVIIHPGDADAARIGEQFAKYSKVK
jgi:hypothetical protein